MSVSALPHAAVEDAALTAADAAQFLGLATKTLANWRGRGVGPRFVRYGSAQSSRVAYLLEDLRAFRDASRVEM